MPGPALAIAKAKINLALHVLGRREDGYHVLDSIVAFADCGDRLTFDMAAHDSLVTDGPFGKDVPHGGDNIVMKAVHALRQLAAAHGQFVAPVAITLEKNLPVASGIGGGSADAAATLRGLIALCDLKLDHASVAETALALGADVPVCLAQVHCRMTGIGETVEFLGPLPARAIVLVNPLVSQSTKAVFDALGLEKGGIYQPASTLSVSRNDLLEPARTLLPVINDVLAALHEIEGLGRVGMSGSGATCFGLADDLATATHAASLVADRHKDWWTASGLLA
jgi:4-diphosphocytidyl-2-C-methyl-D-erythritol kinase